MAIFVVFRVADPKKMEAAMLRIFPHDHLLVRAGEWLVSTTGTAKEVSDKLQITAGNEAGAAIVFSMANYYGRATSEIWEWIKAKAEGAGG
jgi:hypothetical protein